MVYWAPLLHFYQPPLQLNRVLRKVCNESYRPLIEVFRQYPSAKATVNINAVLTEMLWESCHSDVIEGLRELAAKGQIEFTGSAKYHPILPLIPKEETERQIRRNYLTNRYFFGELYSPKGFFPPELAYGPQVLEPVVESRHQWIILSGVACPVAWPTNVIHEVGTDDERLSVLFRDDILSNQISFKSITGDEFLAHLCEMCSIEQNMYVVTAMDAETFGHHIQNWERLFLAEVYEALQPGISAHDDLQQRQPLAEQHRGLFEFSRPEEVPVQVVTISELLALFPKGAVVEPRPSSWSTSKEDIAAGNFYPLWKDPRNVVHWLQWQHLDIAMAMVQQAEACANSEASRQFAEIARHLLNQAEHSCQFWWANNPSRWDINLISRGLNQQREAILNAFRAMKVARCSEEVLREQYYRVLASRDIGAKIRDRLFED